MLFVVFFFVQEEDGIRDLVRSRGLGDVYKRQLRHRPGCCRYAVQHRGIKVGLVLEMPVDRAPRHTCLLYTSDAADERSSVDLGGRRIIKKKNKT